MKSRRALMALAIVAAAHMVAATLIYAPAVVLLPRTVVGTSIYDRISNGAGATANNNQVRFVDPNGLAVATNYPAAAYPATTEKSWNYSIALDVWPDTDPNYGVQGVTFVKYIYVADTANHRIRRFQLQKKTTTPPSYNMMGAPTATQYLYQWGSYGSTVGTNAATTRFAYPGGIAVHPVTHDVYVADTMNSRILVFEFTTDPNVATPRNIVLEAARFVSSSWSITTVNPANSHVMGTQGDMRNPIYPDPNILAAQATITDDGGSGVGVAELGQGQMYYPHGIAIDVDPGLDPNLTTDDTTYLYIADTWNHRIQVFKDTSPGYAAMDFRFHRMWGGYSQAATGYFRYPYSVATWRNGANVRVFVADTRNRRLQYFDRNSITENYAYGGTFGTSSTLVNPVAIACDSAGNVYVVDPQNDNISGTRASRIRKYTSTGTFTANIGATAISANTLYPYGISVAEVNQY